MGEITVSIIEPDITPEENARIVEQMRAVLESIKYEDLLQIKKA